eukprot:TRINITY_DN1831_c0_g1_i4.p1 TRINITY_DN1831_c0_g1~~TRINITY_DN1831_c0_g1_i4.p1  ORF type:complete len:358 (-),score=138.85 TRINITY_DN1831_c0_g1_i4:65-1138(-)
MKLKLSFIVFAALITLCCTISIRERLEQLDNNEFGKRILDIIQVQINTGETPVQTILDILMKLREGLLNEQKNLEAVFQNSASDCLKMKPQLKAEIRKYKKKKIASETSLTTSNADLEDLQLQLRENEKVHAALKEQGEALNKAREDERKKYEDAVSDIARMREALKRAKEILSQIASGESSFAELDRHMGSFKVEYDYARGLQKMANTFAQMASKADPKLLNHIFEVIDRIIQQLGENEFALTQSESVKTKLHEAQAQQQRTLIFDASTKIQNVNARIQDVKNRQLKLKNDISHYDTSIQQKLKELGDKAAQCKTQKNSYDQRVESIHDQLAIIEEVINLVHTHIEPVKDLSLIHI